MGRRWTGVWLVTLAVVTMTLGCSEPEADSDIPRCTPGAVVECECTGEESGTQTCEEDGTLGPCDCPDDQEPGCTPGEVVECECTGEESGTQTCGDDGVYGACDCPGDEEPIGECTEDDDCRSDEVCWRGETCVQEGSCLVDTDCPDELVCEETDNVCVECLEDGDCDGEHVCGDDHSCVDCPEGDAGFSWDQTFTDTSWVEEAGDDLNVEKVTTLDFDAPGGLYEAVDSPEEPTVVVFEVGGVIEIPGHNWRIRNDQVWVAGETAPWPGITITQGRTRIHDPQVILSHLSFLQGDQGLDEFDSTLDIDADDAMIDHVTTGWSTEENIGIPNDVDRASVINTIIAEGLFDNEWHSDPRARGFLARTDETTDITHMGCLYAHNNRRHPLSRADMFMANNYIYNFTHHPGTSSGNIINFAGSSYDDPDITAKGLHLEPGAGTPDGWDREVFNYGANFYVDDIKWDEDNRELTDGEQNMVSDPPIAPPGLDLDDDLVEASETRDFVLSMAGPRPADRAPYEEDLIGERLQEPHSVIDSQDELGGYPDYDETTHTLDVPEDGLVDWIGEFRREVEQGC